jgi:hypothetical protein
VRVFLGPALLGLAALVLVAGFGSGVVREHCIDSAASNAVGEVLVESRWTYVIWPPLVFAGNDPSDGRCIRNHPGTAALQYLGVRDLGGPNEQVRRSLREKRGK